MISYAPLFRTMKAKNITSYKLEKLGFSRATYYSIRSGNSVSTNTINQLCKILQCNVSDEQIDTTLRYAMVNQNNVKLSHRKYIS